MTVFGLCLATGSVVGLIISGQVVQRFGAKRTLLVTGLSQVVALPIALAIVLNGSIPFGVVAGSSCTGSSFATADVAMNAGGAGSERALGRSRLPLMHAGYSIGAMVYEASGSSPRARRAPCQNRTLRSRSGCSSVTVRWCFGWAA